MSDTRRGVLAGLLAGVALLMSGCESTCPKSKEACAAKDQAVMCSKCQTVWVARPHQMNKVIVYSKVKTMVCPDCQSAAENFFKTGKFEHTCKMCGDSLTTCSECK